jgi:uncharacterized cupredoxin-like copper-binding protein
MPTTEPITRPTNGSNGRKSLDETVVPAVALEAFSTRIDARLGALEADVREQGRKVKSAQSAWSIFAVLALLIAGANLVAVAVKLDGKNSTPAVAQPVAASSATAAAGAAAPAVAHTVGISLKEFAINPTVSQAAAGKVTFSVRNAGKVMHEFVVVKTSKTAAELLPAGKVKADESGNVGETGDLAPGVAKTLHLKLTPGHYVLLCNLPGHYAAGQHSDLTVS